MDGQISVLLVEHDPQAAQLLLLLLAAPDARRFETLRVEDVETGLKVIERDEPVDAVLVGLPLVGGRLREKLRALRRRAPGLPIVALVEPGAEALGREAAALGAESFQVRSPDSRALKRAVAAAISAAAARSARREPVVSPSPAWEAVAVGA